MDIFYPYIDYIILSSICDNKRPDTNIKECPPIFAAEVEDVPHYIQLRTAFRLDITVLALGDFGIKIIETF